MEIGLRWLKNRELDLTNQRSISISLSGNLSIASTGSRVLLKCDTKSSGSMKEDCFKTSKHQ